MSPICFRRFISGIACARLRDPHLPRSKARLFPRRSPPRLLTAAARGGLQPSPAGRLRRATRPPAQLLHLRHSSTISWSDLLHRASFSVRGTHKIEHRLFSFIARNWRGQPLVSRQAVVSLIGATTSTAGLKVYAQLDDREYEKGIKVTDAQLATINITRNTFHGDWNYTVTPSHAQS